MSDLRRELVSENKKIHWEPEYIQEGRFGEWLREIKDWAISRERYWGTPLPIWQTADGSKRVIVDSLEMIKKYTKRSGNEYFVMRHGGTIGNTHEVVSFKDEANDPLTPEGEQQAKDNAQGLKDKGIDLIITSPFRRTRETTEIVRKELGLPEDAVVFDDRLKEVNPGELDGQAWSAYHDYMLSQGEGWFTAQVPGGESLQDVGRRVGQALYELENTYKDKKILIVTHGGPAWLLYVTAGEFRPENKDYKKADTHVFIPEFKRFNNAEVRKLDFVPLPHDANFSTDLHRPYIDDVVLLIDGEEYTRVKEVMDVWFDSGAMPFAQDARDRVLRGEQAGDFSEIAFPAQYISEGIDQTRGWFYTLHAIGVLMGRGRAYENVICLGHLTDKDGRKMSKSVGNVIDPWVEMDKYGVDVLRLWMYSINQPGESKSYDDRTVDEIQKRIFNLVDNVYSFYALYRDKDTEGESVPTSAHPLDRWALALLRELIEGMTQGLDGYRLLEPTRALRAFIDDLSTWYLRRSRDRVKGGDKEAKETLYFVLKSLSKLFAPLAPFFAEDLYQKLRTESDPLSVHLASWPITDALPDEEDLLKHMKRTRELASLGLEARNKSNLKVRQPLKSMKAKLDGAFADILKDELNVKEVLDADIEGVELDTNLTPELIAEGEMRDLVRKIQDLRKEKGLSPDENMIYEGTVEEKPILQKYKQEIESLTHTEIR